MSASKRRYKNALRARKRTEKPVDIIIEDALAEFVSEMNPALILIDPCDCGPSVASTPTPPAAEDAECGPDGHLPPGISDRDLKRLRRTLMTDAGMSRFLDDLCGAGAWTYDPSEDVWVVPDHKHQGPGRGFMVVKRGGDWFKAVLNELS